MSKSGSQSVCNNVRRRNSSITTLFILSIVWHRLAINWDVPAGDGTIWSCRVHLGCAFLTMSYILNAYHRSLFELLKEYFCVIFYKVPKLWIKKKTFSLHSRLYDTFFKINRFKRDYYFKKDFCLKNYIIYHYSYKWISTQISHSM